MFEQTFIQNPEVEPKQRHTSSIAAAGFLIPCASRDNQDAHPRKSTQKWLWLLEIDPGQVVSGAGCLGCVQGGVRALRGAAEPRSIKGGVTERVAQHLLVFHSKRLLQLGDSGYLIKPKRFRPGTLAG